MNKSVRDFCVMLLGLRLVAKKGNGFAKLSMAVGESNTRSSVEDDNKKINKNPIIVIDNYDSFTYNLCQV